MSPPQELYRCATCGASLSLEQLRGTDCPYCHTVFPHHGRAAEQAALVNQIMAQQTAQAGYPGAWQPPPAQYGVTPPQYGAPPQYGGPAQNPYGMVGFDPTAQVARSVKRSMVITFVAVGVSFLVITIVTVLALVLR